MNEIVFLYDNGQAAMTRFEKLRFLAWRHDDVIGDVKNFVATFGDSICFMFSKKKYKFPFLL